MEAPHTDCPLSPCVKLLAGTWTLEILYYLRQQPLRYGELRRALGKISSKVLTVRLREMEQRGILDRRVIPTNPPMVEYSLSEIGLALLPVLDVLSEVSTRLHETYGL